MKNETMATTIFHSVVMMFARMEIIFPLAHGAMRSGAASISVHHWFYEQVYLVGRKLQAFKKTVHEMGLAGQLHMFHLVQGLFYECPIVFIP